MAGYLGEAGQQLVTDAVTAAELSTSGEIVTVLADRSDGYSDFALLWAAAAGFTAMSLAALFPQSFLGLIDAMMGGWGHQWTTGEQFGLLTGLGLVVFAAMWLAQLWQALKFMLVPGPVKSARVRDKAVALFKVGADRRTQGRTGVLLYLSMQEHRAEIVADESIALKVPAEVWGGAMADMLAEIGKGRVAEGLAAGVRDVGQVLSEHFPRDAADQNELPDRLIEI